MVVTSTYGLEIVSGIIVTEIVLDIRYRLIMLGVPMNGPSPMYGDNMIFITNCSLPSIVMKKKHNAIDNKKVRESLDTLFICLYQV